MCGARPLNLGVRCMEVSRIAWSSGAGILLAIVWLSGAHSSEATAQPGPKLSSDQAARLAAVAMTRGGARVLKYEARPPEFLAQEGMWHVFFRQKGPLYMVDGDMVVVVNDRTRKTCVGQMMVPPGPCT